MVQESWSGSARSVLLRSAQKAPGLCYEGLLKSNRTVQYKSACPGSNTRCMLQARSQLEVLSRACQEVQGSQDFTTLLQAVLALGNHLNEGTHKGNASGLSTLVPYLVA